MKKVAWIRLVIEEINYCLFSENSSRMAVLLPSVYWIVSMNMVPKVVKLKTKLEKAPSTRVSFPKKVLKMFVPVETILVRSGLAAVGWELRNPL